AEKLCSRVAVIRQGRLLAEGPPDQLRAQKGGPRVEIAGSGFTEAVMIKLRDHRDVRSAEVHDGMLVLELQDGATAAPMVRILVESGAEVEEVRKAKISLEDVFLALVEEDRDG